MKHIIVICALLCSSVAFSQPDLPRHREMAAGHHKLIEKLNLADEQRKQFDTFSSALQKKQIALRSKMMSARVDLRDLVREDTPSKSKIQALQNEINKFQAEMKTNMTDFWFDINTILKPEQQKEWKSALMMPMEQNRMKYSMRPGMKGRRGDFRGHDDMDR